MGVPPCGGIVVVVIMVRMPVVMIAMRIMARFGGMGVIAVIAMFVCMIVVMPMIMPSAVFGQNIYLDGRVSTRVEYLAGVNINN